MSNQKTYINEIKNARRHFLTGEVVLSDLSPKAKVAYKKRILRFKKNKMKAHMPKVDKRLYYDKWYPWCYKGDIPTVYPQGFYDLWYPKKKLILSYGPDALKYIHWIKGKDAIEKGFALGKSLYINGSWVGNLSKVYYPPELAFDRNHKSYKQRLKKALCKGSARDIEKSLIKALRVYMRGRPILIKKNNKGRSNLRPGLF